MEVVGIIGGILSVLIGIWLAGGVSVESIYGYYPEKYGMPSLFAWPVAFFCTIMSVGGLWVFGVVSFAVMVGIVIHLKTIKGPFGWYNTNTEPPDKKNREILKDVE